MASRQLIQLRVQPRGLPAADSQTTNQPEPRRCLRRIPRPMLCRSARGCWPGRARILAALGHACSSLYGSCQGRSSFSRGRSLFSRGSSAPSRAFYCRAAKDLGPAGQGPSEGASRSTDVVDGPWLIVGLGNPGSKYDATRHNVGFELVDALAAAEGISLGSMQCKAVVGKGRISGVPVLLAKPQTFMNLSGESVGPLAKFYKVPLSRVLVMYDDLDLDVAAMKLLAKGGHGGHNGMRSIIERFGGEKGFARLRFGIGRPPGKMETKIYVLQKFNRDEREEVDIAISRAVDGVRLVLDQGLDRAVSQWNQARKTSASMS